MPSSRRTRPRAGSERRAYWQQQVEAHRRSGLSQAAFCAQRGLRKGTLGFWRWKLAREARVASTGSRRGPSVPPFIPVQLTARPKAREALAPAPLGDGVEIELTIGTAQRVRVRGRVDPAWLVQVLRGLEPTAC